MNGYDLDGVLTAGVLPEHPYVVISGRTWSEPAAITDLVGLAGVVMPPRAIAVRGTGAVGDRPAAGYFKANMINLWRVTRFVEDDQLQADIIREHCPGCTVVTVGG